MDSDLAWVNGKIAT